MVAKERYLELRVLLETPLMSELGLVEKPCKSIGAHLFAGSFSQNLHLCNQVNYLLPILLLFLASQACIYVYECTSITQFSSSLLTILQTQQYLQPFR